MQLRFTTAQTDEDIIDEDGKRPELQMTNKWYMAACRGQPRHLSYLAERRKHLVYYKIYANTRRYNLINI